MNCNWELKNYVINMIRHVIHAMQSSWNQKRFYPSLSKRTLILALLVVVSRHSVFQYKVGWITVV